MEGSDEDISGGQSFEQQGAQCELSVFSSVQNFGHFLISTNARSTTAVQVMTTTKGMPTPLIMDYHKKQKYLI